MVPNRRQGVNGLQDVCSHLAHAMHASLAVSDLGAGPEATGSARGCSGRMAQTARVTVVDAVVDRMCSRSSTTPGLSRPPPNTALHDLGTGGGRYGRFPARDRDDKVGPVERIIRFQHLRQLG
jgi:hypothetical protein